ncbi:putative DNA-directed RNA polymerase [Gaertneriomyces semiglobifer]|nr:putative DNA-directed RNA polymerase [Gaertneriomyces semiglobifer]
MAMIEPTADTWGYPHSDPSIPKVEVIPTSEGDPYNVTFCLTDEDHTLGNSLRYIIMKNPAVNFCGYSIPHPSEFKVHIRIQTNGTVTAKEALDKGLDDLIAVAEHISSVFSAKVSQKDYEIRDGAQIE